TLSGTEGLGSEVGVNVGADSALTLAGLSGFNQALTGGGALNISNANRDFRFGANAGNQFAGRVNLSNVLFNLSGDNGAALGKATLLIGREATVSVGAGAQATGSLTLGGGTTVFAEGGSLTTGTLAITDSSAIQVTPDDVTTGNLLDQDDGTQRRLVSSSNTLDEDALAKLTLQNTQGEALGDGAVIAITQNNGEVATGTYNYALTGVGGGLTVTAQLIKLALASGKTLALDTAGASSKIFSAQISGAGGLALNAAGGTLTLSNAENNYTGATSIDAGTVVAGSDSALGNTAQLTTAAGAAFNLSGRAQTLGALTNNGAVTLGENGALTSGALANGGTVDIGGGALTLTDG
ncbi:autotransporter-associated beta strand repeat-containing protein, partial [Pantoea sp. 1.19]|uniref:autotransporter-associated beta strand repeat-containing protein n=1 Tax=Pantoea sp. 1.19 TaxID=1925589 RepID=UPI00352A6FE3